MTPKQIDLVKTSWASVVPISEAAARVFYDRLFELDPELRHLFRADIKIQGAKLMKMIDTAVGALDRLDSITSAVRDLGVRHVAYGVRDRDYDTVGAALLWTLEEGLGDVFTREVRDAWAEVYGILANAMREAARKAA